MASIVADVQAHGLQPAMEMWQERIADPDIHGIEHILFMGIVGKLRFIVRHNIQPEHWLKFFDDAVELDQLERPVTPEELHADLREFFQQFSRQKLN